MAINSCSSGYVYLPILILAPLLNFMTTVVGTRRAHKTLLPVSKFVFAKVLQRNRTKMCVYAHVHASIPTYMCVYVCVYTCIYVCI